MTHMWVLATPVSHRSFGGLLDAGAGTETPWKPHASANYDWDPAWAPFAILPLLVMWAWSIIVPLRGLLGIQTAPKASARGRGKAA